MKIQRKGLSNAQRHSKTMLLIKIYLKKKFQKEIIIICETITV